MFRYLILLEFVVVAVPVFPYRNSAQNNKKIVSNLITKQNENYVYFKKKVKNSAKTDGKKKKG